MSSDEDTELRDLVAQTLESNGVLGKIRAELRANVFLTLEEQESVQNKTPFLNKELKQFLATKEGRLVAGLVEEFLECFNLEFTQAVFEPESGVKSVYEGRQILAEHLSLKQLSGDGHKEPLLKEVVSRLKGDNSSSAGSADFQPRQVPSAEAWTIPEDLSSKQIQDARRKFDNYDTDHNGIIDKDELRNLFTDIFPSFHRNMLERYVNDEFRAVDKDFSNSIDFEEFLGMYRRLFVQCRSVVAGDVADLVNSSNKSNLSNASVDRSEKSKGDSRGDDPRSGPNSLSQGQTKPDLDPYSSDVEEDPFFDDPVPSTATPGLSAISKGGSGDNSVVGKLKDEEESPPLPKTKPPELSSQPANDTKSKEENSHLRALDKRMSDMDLSDMGGDFQYEDDFLSTQSVSQKSPRTVSKSEVRTLNDGSISEEIEEEIDDISIEADDLLKSQNSAFDDLTTDRTISQHDTGFDYAEDIQLP